MIKYPKGKDHLYQQMIDRLKHDGWCKCELCSNELYDVYHDPKDRNCEEKQCPGNQ